MWLDLLSVYRLENSSASDEVFKAVEKTLRGFPFSYQGARLLAGQEEGAFGWVTVNYLDDRLTQVSMGGFKYTSVHKCPTRHGFVCI